jgi:hypothetical protein
MINGELNKKIKSKSLNNWTDKIWMLKSNIHPKHPHYNIKKNMNYATSASSKCDFVN